MYEMYTVYVHVRVERALSIDVFPPTENRLRDAGRKYSMRYD